MTINERTTVSLFAVITGVPFLVGGLLWLTSIDAKASSAKDQINEIRPVVSEILSKVIRIEEQTKRGKEK